MKIIYIHYVKKTFSVIFFVVISLSASNFYAQTTNIPDPNFEQALMDLGIDSDGLINGLVLTSDIESIITLDVSTRQISDLTGIESFAALEELNASINNITSLVLDGNNNLKKLLVDDNLFLSNLEVTNNILLKELSLGKDQPAPSNGIENLDLSNNTALEKLHLINMVSLEYVDIKSGNNQILIDVLIYCETHSGATCLPLTCMEVMT